MSREKRKNTLYNPYDGLDFKSAPAMQRTQIVERMYIRILTEWASTRFAWEGLPPEIDARFLEQQLFYNAFALFYKSEEYDQFMAVRGHIQGPLNVYDNATAFRTVGIALYKSVELKASECVPIWASYSRFPSRDVVMLYARRLADVDTSLDVNLRAMRHNKIAAVEEGQRLSVTNVIRQMEEGAPVIYVQPNAMGNVLDSVSVIDLGVNPSNIAALRMEKNQIWNEAMTYMGITNANQDKKERLVAAEATGADGQVLAARNAEMKPRQEACDRINEMFGLNVSVKWDLEEDIAPGLDDEPDDKPESKPTDREAE